MSTVDNVPSSLCRIVGLTSSEGKKRNGSAARVNLTKHVGLGADSRHPVCVDGFPGPMSIKASNIQVFPQNARDVSVGVGRGTLVDTIFQSTLVEHSQISAKTMITGGAARSRGNLEAMENFVRQKPQKGNILMKLTDLNIARAMNRVALGEEVQLAAPLNEKFQSLQKKFPKNNASDQNIMVKFESHRVHEDRFQIRTEKLGPQRHGAVKLGTYQIYPCALKQYMDAHEVRYADASGDRKDILINHEIYLDYGVEEATSYPKHAAAMNESYRLFPAVLAEVDPQAFWSSILWLQPFIQTLEELQLSAELINEWKVLEAGKDKSKEYLEKFMASFGLGPTLKGPEENWGITRSSDVHLRIATDYAIVTVETIQKALVDICAASMSSVKLNTLDYYIGTELDNYITGTQEFRLLARQEAQETGKELSLERTAKLFDKAMKSVGFGRDSKFRIQDPEKVCDNCGRKSKKKLLACARCEGASYCNAKCQKEHWKQHRSGCSRVLVQLEKQMAKLRIKRPGGPKMVSGLYPYGSSSLPPGPIMISEVSGMGMIGIFWNPGSISYINLMNADVIDPERIAAGETSLDDIGPQVVESSIQFKDFSELHPTTRFLVCCGPLPQLKVARQCASEAIRFCDGKIDELRVPNLGFTALEWAAKKGNLEIVKWLCTDERTKELVHIGCPVGWAGYTGQIEIMRLLVSYGADPGKTDVVLWGGTPPLMVAATNGQVEALKFFVEECKQDVGMLDQHGKNILKHIKDSPNWRDLPGHVACHKWAKEKLGKTKEVID